MSDTQKLDAAIAALERIQRLADDARTLTSYIPVFARVTMIADACREALPMLRDAPDVPEPPVPTGADADDEPAGVDKLNELVVALEAVISAEKVHIAALELTADIQERSLRMAGEMIEKRTAERNAAVTALKPFAGEAAWFKKTDADGRTLNSFQNTVYESNSFPHILTDNPAHRLRVFHFRDAADTLRQQEGDDIAF